MARTEVHKIWRQQRQAAEVQAPTHFLKLSAHNISIASVASSSEMSLQEPSASKKPLSKKDKLAGGVNLKKSIAKKAKPKDTESNGKLEPLHF